MKKEFTANPFDISYVTSPSTAKIGGEQYTDIHDRMTGLTPESYTLEERGYAFPQALIGELQSLFGDKADKFIEDVSVAHTMALVENYFRGKKFGFLRPSDKQVLNGERIANMAGYLLTEKQFVEKFEERYNGSSDFTSKLEEDNVEELGLVYNGVRITLDLSSPKHTFKNIYKVVNYPEYFGQPLPKVRVDGMQMSGDDELKVFVNFAPVFLRLLGEKVVEPRRLAAREAWEESRKEEMATINAQEILEKRLHDETAAKLEQLGL
ncbi:hypothetical protein A3K34_03615 [candidate division WWE3 bacterium RIFOXYC1_FULL_40_10]|uniref:Uncharacterized protein n=1 Tax=candidate division WWE3 bacterium RIFOXYA2_FULL_46_9 TaxID=1802636 RepID=A0A1F4VZ55_UNCKA|nr:MAG: hypothetical protein A3K58_03615 [candidate division WWE3 bacterium RIFOXYB1_FULL_40_22]OGC61932.1 MAG: hypothetical protein A3K37_03615 [candidate division WWE3 bacterium RIFOXYA1_FULL_40_11]OGC62298.1 MAG: hypothetical protein A2264_03370 [candidate division WWE3 bacterium RIFOXYA2_FULL_46_9]OGC66315.1 MAG: hypothetical protein A3K34_03615 [candidate division WWE3 bacterium RIFOXYC1_FULL_40_10]OGC67917.1 MAG: hypothetical protein A2450_01810 [candidate division WWE3 bacterium RIFOXYC2